MNYLAHACLSFEDEGILLGNMISDFVKGRQQYDYPEEIRKGILLHRRIDEFTDNHVYTREAKKVFHADYRLYSGAFVDVAYDHFLATDPEEFSSGALLAFSLNTYRAIRNNLSEAPAPFVKMFYYMQEQNWLLGYATLQGIDNSFNGLVRRARYLHNSGPAMEQFRTHYHFLQTCYRQFWAALKPFALEEYKSLTGREYKRGG